MFRGINKTRFCIILSMALLSEVLVVSLRRNTLFGSTFFITFQQENPSVISSIVSGTEMAMESCQETFKWDRWNCPKAIFTRLQQQIPTKETAFSKALLAAGIVYSITKNCSQGIIDGCSCSRIRKDLDKNHTLKNYPTVTLIGNTTDIKDALNLVWGGCSDDATFAMGLANRFFNVLERGYNPNSFVARHNFKIGMEMVQKTRGKKCRCHGISGSCVVQTCWLVAINFGDISKKLRLHYKRSKRVTYGEVQNAISFGNSARHERLTETIIPGTHGTLIYLEPSPDYCAPNHSEGFIGTKGRMCSRKNQENITKEEKYSCKNVCKQCGHQVRRLEKTIKMRCNCTFSWCCQVNCLTCNEHVDEYFCEDI